MISIRDASLYLGATLILKDANYSLDRGERIALVGRNGAGKSTLMRMLNGQFELNEGTIEFRKGVKTAYLPQEVPQDIEGRVEDIILQGLGPQVQLLLDYHQQARVVAENPTDKELEKLQKLQEKLDISNGWEWQSETDKWCSLLELDPQADIQTLSGGLKRRVLLGKALIAKPDLLMLDEPTNHLDIPSIQWMEQFLTSQNLSLLFVTHDKAFMNNVSTAIVELDRGRLLRFPSPYSAYMEEKERQLEVEAVENKRFDKKLAEEEVWIRKSLQARRTRNMGRVRALKDMREERKARINPKGQVQLEASEGGKSGAKVFRLKNIHYSWGEKKIVEGLDLLIGRGDKWGIVGPNGCGKSTLVKLILGQLTPDQGTVKEGTRIELGYFDQLRNQLDDNLTPKDIVFDGYEYADVHGKKRHVIGYLEQFLFDKNRAQTPVKVLSGGERNRLLLARMLAKPANVLVLDEPTNDLDLETLELLESLLVEYEGTVLMVSHDRDFMESVCTGLLVFEAEAKVKAYVAGVTNWEAILPAPKNKQKSSKEKSVSNAQNDQPKKEKLTYKERKELTALPDKIEELEQQLQQAQAKQADPKLYKSGDQNKIKEAQLIVESLESKIADMMQRWEDLLERDDK